MAVPSGRASERGCSSMASDAVRIDHLHLRVPGLSADDGRRLGEEVARLVADRLPADARTAQPAMLNVHVPLAAGTPRDRLAGAIADAILERLR
jgi:hypothetical protein